ncbi:MAG: hypothetical protein JRC99_00060 [Deltaproteobacteria bacterium]|nr:hypothetical protein [Deltaproteobacteria bacterium]
MDEKAKTKSKPARAHTTRKQALKTAAKEVEAHLILKEVCVGSEVTSPTYDKIGEPDKKVIFSARHVDRLRKNGVIA